MLKMLDRVIASISTILLPSELWTIHNRTHEVDHLDLLEMDHNFSIFSPILDFSFSFFFFEVKLTYNRQSNVVAAMVTFQLRYSLLSTLIKEQEYI